MSVNKSCDFIYAAHPVPFDPHVPLEAWETVFTLKIETEGLLQYFIYNI